MFRNYLLIAWKVLQRRKFFTFISLFAISFTLMVLVVMVAFLDHAFSEQAPEVNQNRTLGFYSVRLTSPDGNSINTSSPGYQFLDRYVRPIKEAEKVTVFSNPTEISTYRNGEALKLYVKQTDGVYWEILHFNFLEGRPIAREDEARGNAVAVINKATRERLFGEETGLAKKLELDGQTFTVIGVVDNVSFLRKNAFSDVWLPISTSRSTAYKNEFMGNFQALLQVKSEEQLPVAKAAFQAILPSVELPDPKAYPNIVVRAESFFENTARELLGGSSNDDKSGLFLGLILLFMFLFMLLPTINLVNINISRIIERSSEIGVRKAFGASSLTLVGQFVIENLMLTLVGGLLGLGLSWGMLQLLNSANLIPYLDLSLNFRMFGYALLIMLVFGILSGVYPAWKMSKLHPVDALNKNNQ